MPNPTVSFRLTPYQLAQGLQIIRMHNKDYIPSSINMLVKSIYKNYLTQFSKTSGQMPAELLDEITFLLPSKDRTARQKANQITFDKILSCEKPELLQPSNMEEQPIMTESKITTATDFSPPTDWETN